VPDCRNCGNSIADTVRFCAYCGVPQPVQASSHPAFSETAAASPTPERAFEASDVTIILPRRRANAMVAAATQQDAATPSTSVELARAPETPTTHRSRATALKIGGAAAIVIVAVFAAVAFYASRVAAPAKKSEAPAVIVTTPATAPVPSAARTDQSDAAAAKVDAPTVPAVETAATAGGKDAPAAEVPGVPDATPSVPVNPKAPSKDAARRKARPAAPVAEPAPVETPPPQPVVIAPPPPAPVTAPPEPVKVERVACADSSNPFSREACLWQECAKPEFRSHAECARFTGPGGQR
jgi:hypothetical protein